LEWLVMTFWLRRNAANMKHESRQARAWQRKLMRAFVLTSYHNCAIMSS
jgi:hypothetical protein